MRALKKINNNVALCLDSTGRQVLAMGKGLGYGKFPRELALSEIERTFYHIDDSYIALLQKIPDDILRISVTMVDMAQRLLPYTISPNAVLTMADHIQFAIERVKKKIKVQMPLVYDVQHQYPLEMEIAHEGIRQIRWMLHVSLPESEMVGMALNLVNARVTEDSTKAPADDKGFDHVLDLIVKEAEKTFLLSIDRNSFHFARFASHVFYLYQRMKENRTIDTDNLSMYTEMRSEFPELAECVSRITSQIQSVYGTTLSDEEQLYLMLHVNRICSKESV